ncbi:hypothetical protein LPB41_22295 [Thalassospira sp. MA62]|nr:hypothetical protein [Thalassospira sp. MA62]
MMKAYMFAAVAAVLTCVASPAWADFANVNVGTDDNYKVITPKQLEVASTDSEKTTVAQTLGNSVETSIQNAINNVGNTELLITQFWHKGGRMYYDDTWQHLTVEVWKNDAYVKTCHAYSFKTGLDKPYQATCVKPR